jgi:hypothetical protein
MNCKVIIDTDPGLDQPGSDPPNPIGMGINRRLRSGNAASASSVGGR